MSDLSTWGGGSPDPNPGAEPAGVEAGPETTDEHQADPDCVDCGSSTVAYVRASELSPSLPAKPLCRVCILDRV